MGEGSDFLYRQGVLTYLRDDVVYIVNAHEASDTELVIDLRAALRITARSEHTFKLMHFQDNALAVFQTARSSSSEGHLVVFNTHIITPERPRVLLYERLQTGQKQFVRHNSRSLIYGIYDSSEGSEDEAWRFHAFTLIRESKGAESSLLKSKRAVPFSLERFSSADIGSNISFEIHDDYFYVVTSQVTVDAEGQDPTSYYGGCRYPLPGHPRSDDLHQGVEYWRIWRRQQREGPIHDLWTVLDLQKDENGHGLVISESRREWQDGFSKQKRTFYTEPLAVAAEIGFNAYFTDFVNSKKPATGPSSANADDEDNTVESMLSQASTQMLPASPRRRRRTAGCCQPEYSGVAAPDGREFSLANTKYRSYNYSNSAFLDIVVDDEKPTQCPALRKHIRLRVGSRRLASPLDENGLLRNTVSEYESPPPEEDEQYRDLGIQLWPPLGAPTELLELLNSNPSVSKLKGASDERSVVYMATASDPKHIAPIVFINFDPSIQHRGLKKLDMQQKDVHMQSATTDFCPESGNARQASEGIQHAGNSQSRVRIQRAAWVEVGAGFRLR